MAGAVRVLLNGKKAGLEEVRAAIDTGREQWPVEVRVTYESGDIERFVKEASEQGVRRIVAAGGDGTLNEAVSAMMLLDKDKRPELGIMPLGTANDFAVSAGIPENLTQALNLAITGESHWVDVAKANQHFYINVASGGFGAQVTSSTPTALKNFLGGGAYTLTGLLQAINFTPFPGVVEIDGAKEDINVIVAAVCNGRQAGGGQQLAPGAVIDDGLLDLVAISEFTPQAISEVLSELLEIQDSTQATGNFVKRIQAKSIRWRVDDPMPINLDGEPISAKDIEFSVVGKQIALVLPNQCPLLSS
ncbi:lipid kinase YegS [Thalassotalea mangrovi]|uniref:Lipid kinase YegS n=1 Tax=Thalassotalea mangrovi TaxID=2572245 RepID=A0A4U1B3L2_9GAMM|nr:lipid kinase YegS [Thalassotalea mangrovi]TKB44340.1 lipid kinase YegS [Thalassotalea mangrovi]